MRKCSPASNADPEAPLPNGSWRFKWAAERLPEGTVRLYFKECGGFIDNVERCCVLGCKGCMCFCRATHAQLCLRFQPLLAYQHANTRLTYCCATLVPTCRTLGATGAAVAAAAAATVAASVQAASAAT